LNTVTDDLELTIESTWVEEDTLGYNRIIVLNFFTADLISYDLKEQMRAAGKLLRERIMQKLDREIGIKHECDYVFSEYDNPEIFGGKWVTPPAYGGTMTILKLRDEKHFALFKLYYSN